MEPGKPSSAYFQVLVDSLENQKPLDPQKAMETIRIMFLSPVALAIAELDALDLEVRAILEEMQPRPFGFFRFITLEQLALTIKLYVISWSTLMDVIAGLINIVFDLGFMERDVQFDRIFRNEHVRKSQLPAIFEKHKKTLDWKRFKRLRNDIVHRGRLLDGELESLRDARNQLSARKYPSLLTQLPAMPEEEFKAESMKHMGSVIKLAEQRKSDYEAHYTATRALFADVLSELGRQFALRKGLMRPEQLFRVPGQKP